jgi:hypothetical protein
VPDNPVDRVTVVSSLTTLCLVQMGCVCVKNFFIAHTMHEQIDELTAQSALATMP